MKQNAQQVLAKRLTLIMAGVASACFAAAATAAETDTGTHANINAGTHVSAPDTTQTDSTADTIKNPPGSDRSNARSQSGASPSTESMRTDNDESKLLSGADMKAVGKATK
jgi:hypothetical protein